MLTHRTNLLLSDEEFELLTQQALEQQVSIGEVIRRAIRKTYSPTTDGGINVFLVQKETDVFEEFRKVVKEAGLKGTWEEFYEDRKVGRK